MKREELTMENFQRMRLLASACTMPTAHCMATIAASAQMSGTSQSGFSPMRILSMKTVESDVETMVASDTTRVASDTKAMGPDMLRRRSRANLMMEGGLP